MAEIANQAPAINQTPGQPSNNVAPVQPAATQAETGDLSTKFAHLARKERAFREQQRQFQASKQAWDAEKAKYQPYLGIEDRITKDPIGFLNERGITQEQLASLILNQSNPQEANHIFQLQQENKDLKAQIEKINKRFDESEQTSYDQALNQIGYEAKTLIQSNASDFEMVGSAGEDGIEAIKQLCKITWEEDKVLLSVQEAAEQVEQELLERSVKLASAKKVAAKLQPAQPTEPEKTQTNPRQSHQTTSLNSQTLQPGSRPPRLTEAQRRERAILAAQGKLPA